jgi:hypothetical protein
VTPDGWRRIRGEQDIIVRYEPERAIAALPILLRDPADRERAHHAGAGLLADERVQRRSRRRSRSRCSRTSASGSTWRRGAARRRGSCEADEGRCEGLAKAGRPPRSVRAPAPRGEHQMAREHTKYQYLLDVCKALPPTPTAVAHPATRARSRRRRCGADGLIAPILVGPTARIEAIARESGIDIAGLPIVDAAFSQDSAEKAVAIVREGRAEALMKGACTPTS